VLGKDCILKSTRMRPLIRSSDHALGPPWVPKPWMRSCAPQQSSSLISSTGRGLYNVYSTITIVAEPPRTKRLLCHFACFLTSTTSSSSYFIAVSLTVRTSHCWGTGVHWIPPHAATKATAAERCAARASNYFRVALSPPILVPPLAACPTNRRHFANSVLQHC